MDSVLLSPVLEDETITLLVQTDEAAGVIRAFLWPCVKSRRIMQTLQDDVSARRWAWANSVANAEMHSLLLCQQRRSDLAFLPTGVLGLVRDFCVGVAPTFTDEEMRAELAPEGQLNPVLLMEAYTSLRTIKIRPAGFFAQYSDRAPLARVCWTGLRLFCVSSRATTRAADGSVLVEARLGRKERQWRKGLSSAWIRLGEGEDAQRFDAAVPRWDAARRIFTLPFSPSCRHASRDNGIFQSVEGRTVLQCGLHSTNLFAVEVSSPCSIVQAFAVAITSGLTDRTVRAAPAVTAPQGSRAQRLLSTILLR